MEDSEGSDDGSVQRGPDSYYDDSDEDSPCFLSDIMRTQQGLCGTGSRPGEYSCFPTGMTGVTRDTVVPSSYETH
jgi:hypothetical protein